VYNFTGVICCTLSAIKIEIETIITRKINLKKKAIHSTGYGVADFFKQNELVVYCMFPQIHSS